MSRVHDALRQAEQFAFAELIHQLFQGPSVVAIIGAGPTEGVTSLCEGIASELSRLGRSVVVVSGQALLRPNQLELPDETNFYPGPASNVFLWPSPLSQRSEFSLSDTPIIAEQWLDFLRLKFDSVLLDCPSLEKVPGSAAIAAMAESAVLAVDALSTPKHQVQLDQRTLQLCGVKLAGCILINAK